MNFCEDETETLSHTEDELKKHALMTHPQHIICGWCNKSPLKQDISIMSCVWNKNHNFGLQFSTTQPYLQLIIKKFSQMICSDLTRHRLVSFTLVIVNFCRKKFLLFLCFLYFIYQMFLHCRLKMKRNRLTIFFSEPWDVVYV